MGQTSNTLSDLQRTSYISDQCSFPGPCAREHPEVEGEKESKEAGLHIAGKMEAAFACQTHRGQWVLMQCYTSLIFPSRFLVQLHLQRCPSSHHPHDAKKPQFLAAPAKIRKNLTGSETSTTSLRLHEKWIDMAHVHLAQMDLIS